MVSLARNLGMVTVAEGAETLDELQTIRAMGCDQIQGYIFGHPMDAAAAARRAAASASPVPHSRPRPRPERVALLRAGTLLTEGQRLKAKIRNLSARGALVEVAGDVPIGQQIMLELADGWEFAGEVRWRRGHRLGLNFAATVDVHGVVSGAMAPPRAPDAAPAEPEIETSPATAINIVPLPAPPELQPAAPAATAPPQPAADPQAQPQRRRHPLRRAG